MTPSYPAAVLLLPRMESTWPRYPVSVPHSQDRDDVLQMMRCQGVLSVTRSRGFLAMSLAFSDRPAGRGVLPRCYAAEADSGRTGFRQEELDAVGVELGEHVIEPHSSIHSSSGDASVTGDAW
jgi:hypothetical protein